MQDTQYTKDLEACLTGTIKWQSLRQRLGVSRRAPRWPPVNSRTLWSLFSVVDAPEYSTYFEDLGCIWTGC